MIDKKLIDICFGDFRPQIQKLIKYNVTNGLGYTDSFDDIYHRKTDAIIDIRSLKIHFGLMGVRQLEMKRNLNY